MKFFMPTYAVALSLAVTSDKFEQASAAPCPAGTCTPSATVSCQSLTVTANGGATPLSLPNNWVTCPTGKNPYIASLQATGASSMTFPNDAAQTTVVFAASNPVTTTCETEYFNVGKTDATANFKAVANCAGSTACTAVTKATWACQLGNCDASGCTGDACKTVPSSGGSNIGEAFNKGSLAACGNGKFAYIKKLTVYADTTAGSPTLADSVKVHVLKTGTTPATNAAPTVAYDAGQTCDNQWSNIGKTDTTADVLGYIGCDVGVTPCKFKYKAEWACQVPSCAPATADATFTAQNILKNSPFPITKPATPACATGKFYYLSSLVVGADKTTAWNDFTVTFATGVTAANAAGTALTATPDASTCETKWADVGKTATADVQAMITCATASCDVQYKATWVCQAADPAPAPSKSGAAGVCPAAAWGTALVAAVAGANFAAPL